MQKVLLAAVGLVLLVTGGVIGWFAARSDEPTRSGPYRYRAGSPDLLSPAPAWEEWKYPGSRVHNSSTGGNVTHGEITIANADRVTLLTADDFDRVWAFYKEKCQLRDPGDGGSAHRSQASGTDRQMTITLFDDVRAHSFEGPGHEAVQARAFSVQSLRDSLVGFVYRPRDDVTRVQLVYRPNTEFIGLLKDRVAKE